MATETKNLKLNKPDKTDFYNIDLVNTNMDKIDEAVTGKASKDDIPKSLPANGGNADTVGGKLPSAFAPVDHTHNKADVGLGNVDNTADANKSVYYATTAGNAINSTKVSEYAVSVVAALPSSPNASTIYFVKG